MQLNAQNANSRLEVSHTTTNGLNSSGNCVNGDNPHPLMSHLTGRDPRHQDGENCLPIVLSSCPTSQGAGRGWYQSHANSDHPRSLVS